MFKDLIPNKLTIEESSRIEPIYFGSEIYFRLTKDKGWFLYSDGFIDTSIEAVNFSNSLENIPMFDFEKAVFKILPFSKPTNFRYQHELHQFLNNYEEKADELNRMELKKRRQKINQTRQKFQDELLTNVGIYEKNRGNPVLFGTSTFLLIHKASLKYLALNSDDMDNLNFTLVDYPDDKSFFKFMNSLKIQNQRNNFVYSNDQIYICSSKLYVNQFPYLFNDTENVDMKKDIRSGLSANLEEKTSWRINIYQNFSVSENSEYLKAGEVIWLHFSEDDYCLEAGVRGDDKREALEELSNNLAGAGKGSQSLDKQVDLQSSMKNLFKRMNIEFTNLGLRKEKDSSSLNGLKPEGMFKIEAKNPMRGERIVWETGYYRFKHVISSQYLYIDKDDELRLESELTDKSLFSFHPIKFLNSEKLVRFVKKDAYFKVKNKNKKWFRFPLHKIKRSQELEGSLMLSNRSKNSSMVMNDKYDVEDFKAKFVLEFSTHMDTLKVSKANNEEIWQSNFLLSCTPILMQGIIVLSRINGMGKDKSTKYFLFEELYHNLIFCIESLTNFVLNKLPSSLSLEEEFGIPSMKRQQTLIDIEMCDVILILLENIFPNLEEMDSRTRRFIHDSFKLGNKNKKVWVEEFVNVREDKLDYFHYLKRVEVLDACYNLLSCVCKNNKRVQLFLSIHLGKLTRYLGLAPSVGKCLIEIVKNNSDILMNFSKLRTGEGNLENIRTYGLEFFESTIDVFKLYYRYTKQELLEFVSHLCHTENKSYYLNQNNIANSIKRNNIYDNHFIKSKIIIINKSESRLEMGSARKAYKELEVKFYDTQHNEQRMLLKDLSNDKKKHRFYSYFAAQLDLYNSLCINRNTINARYFQQRYNLNFLNSALNREDYSEDLRAIFLRLMISLYIDKVPRKAKNLPIMLRKYAQRVPKKITNENQGGLNEYGSNENLSSKEKMRQDTERMLLNSNKKMRKSGNKLDSGMDSPKRKHTDDDGVDPNYKDTKSYKSEKNIFEAIKVNLVNVIEKKSKILLEKENITVPIYEHIYNDFTFECLKCIKKMLKFGFYDLREKENIQYINKMIKAMAILLEYNREYSKSMKDMELKFKYLNRSKERGLFDIDLKGGLEGLKNIKNIKLNNLTDIKNFNLFSSDSKQLRKGIHNAITSEVKITDKKIDIDYKISGQRMFKKNMALKKVLSKFLNKTYQAPANSKNEHKTRKIKVQICDIYMYLMDLREEFLLRNAFDFFKNSYLPKMKKSKKSNEEDEDHYQSDLRKMIMTVFPDMHFEVSENKAAEDHPKKKGWKKYSSIDEHKSFDMILDRSFYEVLIISFYFADQANLQNKLIKLIQRYSLQRKAMKENLENTLVLFSEKSLIIYDKIKENNTYLKSFENMSQVWLLIIKKKLYQSEYNEHLSKALKKLRNLRDYFEEGILDSDLLKTKQDVMRQVGGHETLIQFLKEGAVIYAILVEIMSNPKMKFVAYRTDVFKNICELFCLCTKNLKYFCQSNPKNQEILYKHMDLFLSLKEIDLGQVELIYQILNGNKSLFAKLTENIIDFLFDLIKIHGKCPKFLFMLAQFTMQTKKPPLALKEQIASRMLSGEFTTSMSIVKTEDSDGINHLGYRIMEEPEDENEMYENEINRINPNKNKGVKKRPHRLKPLDLDLNKVIIGDNLDESIELNDNEGRKMDKYEKIVHPYSFDRGINLRLYRRNMVVLLSNCIFKRLGINLITKTFQICPLNSLQAGYLEVLQKIVDDPVNKLIDDFRTRDIDYISAILNLMNINAQRFESRFKKVLREKKSIKFFERFLKLNIFLIDKVDSSNTEPLMNYFFEHLLKTLNLISEQAMKTSTMNSADRDEMIQDSKILVNKIINRKDDLIGENKLSLTQLKIMKQTAKILRIEIPGIIEMRKDASLSSRSALTRGNFTFVNNRANKMMKSKTHKLKGMVKKKMSRSMISSLKEFESDYQVTQRIWVEFIRYIREDETTNDIMQKEAEVLSNSIINFVMCYDAKEMQELMINCQDIISKLLNYLEFWKQKKGTKSNVIFVLQSLGRIIGRAGDEFEMFSLQNMLNNLGTTKILINMFSSEEDDDEFFLNHIVKVLILLLDQGNIKVQNTVYNCFTTSSSSEKFFSKVYNLIKQQTDFVDKIMDDSDQRTEFLLNLLEMLRLFCEGHNEKLQNYMNLQSFSKNSYNVTEIIVKLLSVTKIDQNNYELVEMIFDTLTEFCQGPCKSNQLLISNSKFIEYAMSLLRGEEKLYNKKKERNPSEKARTFRSLGSRITAGLGGTIRSGSETRKIKEAFGIEDENKNKIEPWKVERLRYKCLITITSLIEQLDSSDTILGRIVRNISIPLLVNNLTRIYKLFKKLYKNKYGMKVFMWYDKEFDEKIDPRFYECIIENGFNILILKKTLEDKEAELKKDKAKNRIDKQVEDSDHNYFTMLGRIVGYVYKFFKDVVKKVICCQFCCKKKSSKLEDPDSLKSKAELEKEALNFFEKHTAQIDIVRSEKIERLYFPLMPFCKNLNEKEKKKFHEKVDRTSTKSKLNDLMRTSGELISIMKHENNLRNFFDKNQLLGLLEQFQHVWERMSFWLSIITNFFIMIFYTREMDEGLGVGFLNSEEIQIFVLGLLVTILSGITFLLVTLKRAPILSKSIWDGYLEECEQKKYGWFKRSWNFIITVVKCFLKCLLDFEYMYQTLYLLFSIFGLVSSYVFFIFHLSDFMRIDVLKGVVSAIYIRRTSLMLTFLLFLLFQYYFTLIGYLAFYQQYPNQRCYKLWECLFQTFDLTFKEGGGVGAFLTDIWNLNDNMLYWRFLFDNLFNLLEIQIMLNMVAGIIIDEFGALKEKLNSRKDDMQDGCFVCGIKKDRLERAQNGFIYHYKVEHNMWNYVFYKAYLMEKPETEYNGTESYIKEKLDDMDLDWFPIRKAFEVEDEGDEEKERTLEIVDIAEMVNESNLRCKEALQKVNKVYEKALMDERKNN